MKSISKNMQKISLVRGTSGGGSYHYTSTGYYEQEQILTLGNLTTVTLSHQPATNSEHVFLNGVLLFKPNSYTISANVIYLNPLIDQQVDDVIFVKYSYLTTVYP